MIHGERIVDVMAAGTLHLIIEKEHVLDSPGFCFVVTDDNRSRSGVVQGTIQVDQSRIVGKRDRMVIAQIST